jgi:predicted O-methyltransferase YrrM
MTQISRVKRIPGFLGRRITSFLETVNGRAEKSRLEGKTPELLHYNQLALQIHEKLQPIYENYISTISTGVMALSLEASVFMSVLCKIYQPRNILDLGSGFSSAAFRQYAETVDPKPQIWSIDDAPDWLEKTEEFLSSHQLSIGHLLTWDSFLDQNQDSFDFVLHDLGSMATREALLPKVLSLASSNGIVFLDDIHKKNYRSSAKRIVKEKGLIYHNLKSYTLDRFKRYCALVTHE